ncbi:MAG: PQQ-like beta-propeller repeat protein, partial [Spirochaetales bacterium]|nr:PQQ-like beta-propeller repeat protein [Spirochaetales bacterium]
VIITPAGDGLVTVSVVDTVAADAAGNLNLGSGAAFQITYDSIPPAVIELSTTAGSTTGSSTIPVRVVFSEVLSTFDPGALAITGGTAGAATTEDDITFDFNIGVTLTGEGDVSVSVPASIVAADPAGNANLAGASTLVVHYDPSLPGVLSTSWKASAPDTTSSYPIPLDITFSEEIVDFDHTKLSVSNGTAVASDTADDITFLVDILPAGDGELTASVAANKFHDTAGNGNAASSYYYIIYDGTGPVVQSVTATSPTKEDPFDVTVVFSEAVNGFDGAADLSVTNGTAGGWSSSDSIEYIIDVYPAAEGDVIIGVLAGAVTDDYGNGNPAWGSLTVDYDISGPEVVSITTTTANPTNDLLIPVDLLFDEPVTGLDSADLVFDNCNYDTGSLSGSGASWSFDVTPEAAGSMSVGVLAGAVADLAGNTNAAVAPISFITYDPVSPSVVSISSTESDPTCASPFSVHITFSEEIADFDPALLSIGNGAADSYFDTVDQITFIAYIYPALDGHVTVSAPAGVYHDLAGNANSASAAPFTITYDGTEPEIRGVTPSADPVNGLFYVTVEFSEPVYGFNSTNDLWVSNGNAGIPATSNNIVYTVAITPASQGNVVISVPETVAYDLAGNANLYWESLSVYCDLTRPVITSISSTEKDPTSSEAITIDVVFSEAVFEFDPSHWDFANCSFSPPSLAGTGANWSFVVEPLTDGPVSVGAAGQNFAFDLAGNGVAFSSASFSIVYDGTPPEVVDIYSDVDGDATNISPVIMYIEFSEWVGVPLGGALFLDNCSSGAITRVSGTTFEVALYPDMEGSFTAQVLPDRFLDAAGNGNLGWPPFVMLYDVTAPTGSITIMGDDPTNRETQVLQFSATDNPGGSGVELMYFFNGLAPPAFDWEIDGEPYQPEWPGWDITSGSPGDGTKQVSILYRDAAGNVSEICTDTVVLDTTPPVPVVSTDAMPQTSLNPIRYTVTFEEDVTGFYNASDIYASGGMVTAPVPVGLSQREYEFFIVDPPYTMLTVYVYAAAAADMAGNDNIQSFLNPSVQYVNPGTPLFENASPSMGNIVTTGLTEGRDAFIYLGAGNGTIYAMNPASGSYEWSYQTPGGRTLVGYPAVADDGTIYVCDTGGYLWAIDPDRQDMKWSYSHYSFDSYAAGPAIGFDGTIYTLDGDGSYLYAINPDGSLKWYYGSMPSWSTAAAPVIGSDGKIYITHGSSYVYAFRDDGSNAAELWCSSYLQSIVGTVAPGGDGYLYAASVDSSIGRMYQLSQSSGSQAWQQAFNDPLVGGPVLDTGGYIYIGDDYRYINRIEKSNGTYDQWYYLGTGVASSAVVGDSGGRVYVVDLGSQLQAIDALGNQQWQANLGFSPSFVGPLLTESGIIYLLEDDGQRISAYTTASPGPAHSSWPMEQHDPRRTGRQDSTLFE